MRCQLKPAFNGMMGPLWRLLRHALSILGLVMPAISMQATHACLGLAHPETQMRVFLAGRAFYFRQSGRLWSH